LHELKVCLIVSARKQRGYSDFHYTNINMEWHIEYANAVFAFVILCICSSIHQDRHPFNGLFPKVNLDKPAPERLNKSGF